MRNIAERVGNSKVETFLRNNENLSSNLRVASPGIIESFDPATQTVSVKLAVRERVGSETGAVQDLQLPLLVDVPIVIPRAGGYCLTLPIKTGDECLVIFSDTCIDAWFSNGGVQAQLENRRHDLSDGFAILGTWSQPNKVPSYSTSAIELRNESRSSYVKLTDAGIEMVSPSVKINGQEFSTHTHYDKDNLDRATGKVFP